MNRHKILIIKTGYSEILDRESSFRRVSFGDILRTTPLLHNYKKDSVTWVTDLQALPLLENNCYIHRLMTYDFTTRDQLLAEEFDTLINLEKFPPLCGLANQIRAWRKYGFRLDSHTGNAEAYDRAFEALTVSANPVYKKQNNKTAQKMLFEMVGAKWNGEEYVLGYNPRNKEKFEVALNTKIGEKWPTKAWPIEYWNKLEKILIQGGLRVTRQDQQAKDVLENLYGYMNWINSSKIIITGDTLGMHLGIALKKKVISLFGPTPSSEVYFYSRGEAIVPSTNCDSFPCFNSKCKSVTNCMTSITPNIVASKIKKYLK